jgi:AcrR family transcriptional regulator
LRKQPLQARAQVTCHAILDATVQVILRDGLAQLSTGRVAERAGVSIGTLYQYFRNRDDLIAAVRGQHVSNLVGAAAHAIEVARHAPPEAVLRVVLAEFVAFKRRNLALSQALIDLTGSPDTRDSREDVNRRFADVVLALLPGVAAAPGPDRRRLATLMVAALDGAISHAVTDHPEWLDEAWYLDRLERIAAACLAPLPGTVLELTEGTTG